MNNYKQIAQGAEAKIFLIKDKIVKDRTPKKYRHPQLDNQLRRRRTKSEAKLLTKATELINTPGSHQPRQIQNSNATHPWRTPLRNPQLQTNKTTIFK